MENPTILFDIYVFSASLIYIYIHQRRDWIYAALNLIFILNRIVLSCLDKLLIALLTALIMH